MSALTEGLTLSRRSEMDKLQSPPSIWDYTRLKIVGSEKERPPAVKIKGAKAGKTSDPKLHTKSFKPKPPAGHTAGVRLTFRVFSWPAVKTNQWSFNQTRRETRFSTESHVCGSGSWFFVSLQLHKDTNTTLQKFKPEIELDLYNYKCFWTILKKHFQKQSNYSRL